MKSLHPWIMGKFNTTYRFIIFVIKRFFEDDCTYRASALAFTSLLAIVPLMSVGLSILSSFPVFQDLSEPLQDFIFDNFVPATGKVIQHYLQQFTAQVSKMSLGGLSFLLVTAILLMVTIENSLNTIWRVATPRKGIAAFLLYWAILSLAPFLLGLSIAVSSWIISMPIIKSHHIPSLLLSGVPFFLSFIAFSFLYVVVPNCYVLLKHALWGGLVAAIFFETAKNGFAWYLTRYDTYQLLYGAFAMVPIFFVWVYWVWVITLLGAEISYALSLHYERRSGQPIDGFTHVLLWLEALWQSQKKGQGLSISHLINISRLPYAENVDQMIHWMLNEKIIHYTDSGTIMLSLSLEHLNLVELAKILPFPIPDEPLIANHRAAFTKQWKSISKQHQHCMGDSMAISLADLFEGSKGS